MDRNALINHIVGELITRDIYKFTSDSLLAHIVRDTVDMVYATGHKIADPAGTALKQGGL